VSHSKEVLDDLAKRLWRARPKDDRPGKLSSRVHDFPGDEGSVEELQDAINARIFEVDDEATRRLRERLGE